MEIPSIFEKIVGFEPIEFYSSIYDWVIAVAGSEEAILKTQPDFELLKKNGLGHLMVTAKSNSDKYDFVVRCFAPALGVNEDPVTASAHCALTVLKAQKLGKSELISFQLSRRTGILKVRLVDDLVEIRGKAVTIFKARLEI